MTYENVIDGLCKKLDDIMKAYDGVELSALRRPLKSNMVECVKAELKLVFISFRSLKKSRYLYNYFIKNHFAQYMVQIVAYANNRIRKCVSKSYWLVIITIYFLKNKTHKNHS